MITSTLFQCLFQCVPGHPLFKRNAPRHCDSSLSCTELADPSLQAGWGLSLGPLIPLPMGAQHREMPYNHRDLLKSFYPAIKAIKPSLHLPPALLGIWDLDALSQYSITALRREAERSVLEEFSLLFEQEMGRYWRGKVQRLLSHPIVGLTLWEQQPECVPGGIPWGITILLASQPAAPPSPLYKAVLGMVPGHTLRSPRGVPHWKGQVLPLPCAELYMRQEGQ